ncbi:MAG: 2-oxoglutarate dehydrogenase E2 component (dihydrolipoamide succinyltransferase), partial [Paracoccaceae bacterium]
MSTEIRVPTLGESVTEATIATWFKKPGEAVAVDEMLCELETDKVTVEVPSPVAGTMGDIIAAEGDTVGVDALLATINEGASAAPAAEPAKAPAPIVAPPEAAAKDVEDAPSAKKLMAEKGVSPDAIEGSGRDGRIMKEDVAKAVAAPASPAPVPTPAPAPRAPVSTNDAPREERVKMTRLRQTVARRLKESQNIAAMLTTYNEVDMGAVMELRTEYKDLFLKKHGVKLGFMS